MNRVPDDLDDLTLPQRPRRPAPRSEAAMANDRAAQEDMADEIVERDREFTLSTGTVLALFFALALICAVFFGFGYSMGRKSASAAAADTAAATTGESTQPNAAEIAANKPAAGSPAIQAIPGYLSQGEADTANRSAATTPYKPAAPSKISAAGSVTLPMDTPAPTPAKPKKPADPDGQIVESRPIVIKPAAAQTPVTASGPVQTLNAGVPTAAGGPVYVQIAAVSHKEDADVLLGALKRRGYTVFTRNSDTDKLIHVQVGPYANKKDAEVMRQKLLGDGYNAILK